MNFLIIILSSFLTHFVVVVVTKLVVDDDNHLEAQHDNDHVFSHKPNRTEYSPIYFNDKDLPRSLPTIYDQGSESLSKFMAGCLPSESQTNNISCTVQSSAVFGEDFEGQCVQKGIVRFIGEFDVLSIRCVAPFHLDFDLDGFQPTEAIKVTSWKEIDEKMLQKAAVSAYHIVLKIYSNNALYHLHLQDHQDHLMSTTKNPLPTVGHDNGTMVVVNTTTTRPQFSSSHGADGNNNWTISTTTKIPRLPAYSRSGQYVVRGMFNFANRLPFYFFFEEQSQKVGSLMFNNFTRTTVSAAQSTNVTWLTVPCRPSHYNATVELYKINSSTGRRTQVVNIVDYNPWTGFTFPLSSDSTQVAGHNSSSALLGSEPSTDFECRLRDTIDVVMIFTFPPENGKPFGFDGISMHTQTKVVMNHEANEVTRDPITVNITCVIQDRDKNSQYLGSIGCHNPTHLRLVREFILPGYQTNSYSVHQTSKLVGESYPFELKIHRAFQTGISYCFSGPYSRIYEYAAGLNRVMYQLDFGTDYTGLPHTSPPKEVHIHLELVEPQESSKIQVPSSTLPIVGNFVRLVIGVNYTFSCRIDLFTVAKTILWHIHFKNATITREKIDYDFAGEFSYLSIIASLDIVRVSCSAPFWNNNKWRTDDLETISGVEENEKEADKYMKIGFVGAGVFIIIVVIGLLLVRKFRRKHWEFSKTEILEFQEGNPLLKKSDAEFLEGGHHLPYDKKYEIDEDKFSIDYSDLLGSGEFGNVFKGSMTEDSRPVAVKAVKPNVDKMYTKALLSELKIMIYLGQHQHLVGLVGAYTAKLRQGTVYIFLEFCSMGSLENYLRKNAHQLQSQTTNLYSRIAIAKEEQEYEFSVPAAVSPIMTLQDLFTWSLEIAQGMDYLSQKGVIHGDLATRNVLLTETRVAKISDFGLSRRLHNYRIYAKTKNQPLPWPWLSPESLTNLVFSINSDVWAFGITIWEIFSLGQTPYPGMNLTLDFVSKLRGGLRNLKPALASNELYKDVMKECWRFDPEDRPSFNELCFILENLAATQKEEQQIHRPIQDLRLSMSSDSGIATDTATVVSAYLPHTLDFGTTS